MLQAQGHALECRRSLSRPRLSIRRHRLWHPPVISAVGTRPEPAVMPTQASPSASSVYPGAAHPATPMSTAQPPLHRRIDSTLTLSHAAPMESPAVTAIRASLRRSPVRGPLGSGTLTVPHSGAP